MPRYVFYQLIAAVAAAIVLAFVQLVCLILRYLHGLKAHWITCCANLALSVFFLVYTLRGASTTGLRALYGFYAAAALLMAAYGVFRLAQQRKGKD